MQNNLTAPFPWFGGKRRWAENILERLGEVDRYIEPFAGSLAVLLHRKEPFSREIVCDTSGVLCNFWRAVKTDPEQTAHWAEYPTIHQDLTARHKWLVGWSKANAAKLSEDPDYCDAKAAGWWVWGISNWIGGGFCETISDTRRPHVDPRSGGQGVQVQRLGTPDSRRHVGTKGGQGVQDTIQSTKRPHVGPHSGGGVGVQVQRLGTPDSRPHVGAKKTGAQGVQVQRLGMPDSRPHVVHRKRGGVGVQVQRTTPESSHSDMPIGNTGFLVDWFDALAHRLRRVVVFNRDWVSVTSPTVLGNTATEKTNTGLFLDPPYLTSDRSKSLYESDYKGTSDEAAVESYKWAIENGGSYRIAYACHEGDFSVPPGWDAETLSFGGPNVKRKMDMVMFSPACVPKGKSEKRNALNDALDK